MAASMLNQIWALTRRYLVVLYRTPIRSFIRIILWPALFLGLITYLLVNLDEAIIKSNEDMAARSVTFVLLMVTSFHVYSFSEWMIRDRATGVKSLLISMGLNRTSYHVTNTICLLSLLLPLTIYVAIFAEIYAFPGSQSSAISIFLIFVLFTFQLVGLSFATVSFITSTSFVAIVFLLIFLQFGLHELVRLALENSTESWRPAVLFAASASPFEVVRIFCDSYILNKNNGTTEFKTKLVSQPTSHILMTSLVWIITTFAFALWFEQVCPWQNDSAVRGPCFCLTCNKDYEQIDSEEAGAVTPSRFFERVESNREVGIRISNVSKSFNNVPALQNVSFDIHKGETTLLLGHNGAGKSTLMNIILGMLQPNKGRIALGPRRSPERISVGVCPQTSVLDDDLTVRQHLELFCAIKSNLHGPALADHITQTLDDVNLTQHAQKVPSELSGGMRRKLSLGMAFVGNSTVLILDEPSSGLDPDSRVFIWNAIRRYRADRTVLLSTQHMEEADYLGDRIAIMSDGRIVCCGSSVFLNKLFGSGYKLRIECRASKKDQVMNLLLRHFNNCKQSVGGAEQIDQGATTADPVMDLQVELHSSDKTKDYESELIRLLEDIENDSERLGIQSYGLKSSSIEDVMLETSKFFAAAPKETTALTLTSTGGHIAALANATRSTGGVSPFYSFLIKHMLTFLRDWKSIAIFRLAVPIFGAYFAINQLDGMINLTRSYEPNLTLSLLIFHLIYYPVLERTSGFKTVQLTSQASIYSYWSAFAVVDFMTVISNAVVMNLFFMFLYDGSVLVPSWQVHAVITGGTIMFGLSATVVAYIVSNLLNDSKSAIGYNILIYSSSVLVYIVATLINLISKYSLNWLVRASSYAMTIIMPTDAFQRILLGLITDCYIQIKSFPGQCDKGSSDLTLGFLCLAGQILVYSILLYYVERENVNLQWYLRPANVLPCLFKAPKPHGEQRDIDSDVVAESNKSLGLINKVPRNDYSLVAASLSKSYYANVKVVEGLSFTVNKGECFGLLGVNGAGKTTTFSMLTAESRPDSGKIWANGHYQNERTSEYRKYIGYDPQATPELSLTPYQALFLMARLRNINEHSIPMLIKSVIELMDMGQHTHKPAPQLSGGTKRKLALGMALIGNPSLLALDEPTAGVDPMARRGVWQLLKSLRTQSNVSIVISSHAMEECEAICDRISIMARGRLRCIGTFLHLRSKFAQGCTLRIQFSKLNQERSRSTSNRAQGSGGSPDASREPVIAQLQQRLAASYGSKGFQLTDKNVNSATFRITDKNLKRSTLFKLMRDFVKTHQTVSYIVNDCSLEDIFISIAREQQDD